MVEEKSTGTIVGTYRMQTGERAERELGYYSATEFDFTPFESARAQILELGQACIAEGHRNQSVLGLLWKGIARYAKLHDSRYLIGCSSITSQDAAGGLGTYQKLAARCEVEAKWRTLPLPGWRLGLLLLVAIQGLIEYALFARNRRTLQGKARWLGTICGRALRRLNVRVIPEGSVPSDVMLTPNHLGYFDILVLSSLQPVVFVAKSEVRSWFVFGLFASFAGTLFIRRQNKSDLFRVGEQLKTVWRDGVNPVVFLEGTSTDGTDVRPFRAGLLEPLVQIGAGAIPVTLKYRVPEGYDTRLDVGWWGTMPLLPHVLYLIGMPWIEVTVKMGEIVSGSTDRKVMAAALETAVRAELRDGTE